MEWKRKINRKCISGLIGVIGALRSRSPMKLKDYSQQPCQKDKLPSALN